MADKCARCKGKGTITCPKCKGDRFYYGPYFNAKDCDQCSKTGEVRCPGCSGSGKAR